MQPVIPVKYSFLRALGLASLLLSADASKAAVTGGFSVDIRDREAVRTFYNAVYGARADARADWTGSVANCVAGTSSAAYREAVLTRLNFYRALAGVPAGVVFSEAYSLRAQEAALIMSANDEISHTPVEGWACFSSLGAEGADNSNLALGSAGMEAVDAYVLDAGPNYRAGHRRWLIYPKTQVMGSGDIDPADGSDEQKANSIWIFDDHFLDARPATRESFVAWPPPGYVPHTLVYPRWSFQISGADFSSVTVTMTSNSVPVSVQKEKVETGYGENGIVFVPHGIASQTRMFWPKPATDIIYQVAISNIVLRGGAVTNYSYSVTVFDPARPAAEWVGVRLSGATTPTAQRANAYHYPALPKATAYEFRAGRLEPFTAVEGAEDSDPAVTTWTSRLYPVIQTNIVATGSRAFHLAHSKPPRPQWLMLNGAIVPSGESELRFKSRLAGATTDQIARVQVSVDDGSSWVDIYEQAGKSTASDLQNPGETAFVERVISLAAYAQRAVKIRFNYGFIFGPPSFARGSDPGVGWYVDDISVSAAEFLKDSATISNSTPDFEYVPEGAGEYYLDVRPRFYTEFVGEWSSGLRVAAVAPKPTSVRVEKIGLGGEEVVIQFQAESLPPKAKFRIESASTLDSTWHPETNAQVEGSSSGWAGIVKSPKSASGFYRVVVE